MQFFDLFMIPISVLALGSSIVSFLLSLKQRKKQEKNATLELEINNIKIEIPASKEERYELIEQLIRAQNILQDETELPENENSSDS